MTTSRPRELLYNTTLTTTSEVATPLYHPHPASTAVSVRISSTAVDLTVDTDELGLDGVYYEVDAARAITAGVTQVLVFQYATGPLRLRITPATTTSTVVVVEASVSGVMAP